jgi:hypothetical protein
MLGKQLNSGAVGDRIGLCQIFHGFDQAALAIYVAGIRSAFSSFATELRDYWNGKNFGHRKFTRRFSPLPLKIQYIYPLRIFQP